MRVLIFHDDKVVAKMTIESSDAKAALAIAFRATNNVHDSWSRPGGDDYDPRMAWIAPLREYEGKLMGHRSTMVGDVIKVDGDEYRVAAVGFEPIRRSS